METTDLHVHLLPYDYFADRPEPGVGLVRTAELIDAARQEAPNTLLLDNGDFLQGTPMGDYMAIGRGLKPGERHPVIAAMNTLGFDAITLGNHEFNYGLDFLSRTLADARFPVVCANLATHRASAPRNDRTFVKPYVLLERVLSDSKGGMHPIRIGVIGFLPPQIMLWERQYLEGRVSSRDIVTAARAWVPEMLEAGADIVLALAHSGIGQALHHDGMENAAVPLGRVEGIDALFTGHSHLVFPSPVFEGCPGVDVANGTVSGKPCVMAGFWGSHLGIIDLLLERDAGIWRVLASHSEARAISRREPLGNPIRLKEDTTDIDPTDSPRRVARVISSAHLETLRAVRVPVGRSTSALHSYFALLGVAPTIRLVAEAQCEHVAQQLAGGALADLPILSSAAPYKAGGRGGPQNYTDIPPGELALRHVSDLYVFPNTVAALKVTGANLAEWLERSASCFAQLEPGVNEVNLLDPDFPSYSFEIIPGLEYEIDLSQPARYHSDGSLRAPHARRIRSLCYKGSPVNPEQHFILCTNSYRASGAGKFAGAEPANLVFRSRQPNRELVRRFISGRRTIHPSMRPVFAFTPIYGATAVYETGPGALEHLSDIGHIDTKSAGIGAGGFARLRISFDMHGRGSRGAEAGIFSSNS